MYPHVDLGQKRQFLIRWKCTIALEKLLCAKNTNVLLAKIIIYPLDHKVIHIILYSIVCIIINEAELQHVKEEIAFL
jgi:hypothetical protein